MSTTTAVATKKKKKKQRYGIQALSIHVHINKYIDFVHIARLRARCTVMAMCDVRLNSNSLSFRKTCIQYEICNSRKAKAVFNNEITEKKKEEEKKEIFLYPLAYEYVT